MFTASPKTQVWAGSTVCVEEQSGDHSATRREILTALGAAAIGLSERDERKTRNHPKNDNKDSSRKTKSAEGAQKPMPDSPAFLTLPGLSFTSLAVHLPTILDIPQQTPIIIIDTHDYERFRGRILEERGNQKLQHLGMLFDDLRRREALRFLNYADYYPNGRQQAVIDENHSILVKSDDRLNRDAAIEAAKGWIEYGRGEYQAGVRGRLGENLNAYENSRYKIEHQHEKMDRGLGDPHGWNENILNQYRAALEVRRQADEHLDTNIPYIIGQGESTLISKYIDPKSNQNPANRFIEISHGQTIQNRELLEEISKIGRDIAGVQHTDWFVFGPRLALPQYNNIFDFDFETIIETAQETDTRTLIEETKEALTILNERSERPVPQIRAEADYITEQYDIQNSEEVREKLDETVALGNYSRDLRDLNNSGISQAALFAAASIKRDPVRRYNENEIYRECVDSINQLEPFAVTNVELERFRDRGSFRREGISDDYGDWYQSTDRWR